MLVDDDPTFNWVSTKLIQKTKPALRIHTFLNGSKALDFLLDNFKEKNHYTILLDINMPVMNGWEFMDALEKSNCGKSADITVFIVTSSTDLSDMENAKTYALIKDYLQKPLRYDVVAKIIS